MAPWQTWTDTATTKLGGFGGGVVCEPRRRGRGASVGRPIGLPDPTLGRIRPRDSTLGPGVASWDSLEGEGWFGHSKRSGRATDSFDYFLPAVALAMNDEDVVRRAQPQNGCLRAQGQSCHGAFVAVPGRTTIGEGS